MDKFPAILLIWMLLVGVMLVTFIIQDGRGR